MRWQHTQTLQTGPASCKQLICRAAASFIPSYEKRKAAALHPPLSAVGLCFCAFSLLCAFYILIEMLLGTKIEYGWLLLPFGRIKLILDNSKALLVLYICLHRINHCPTRQFLEYPRVYIYITIYRETYLFVYSRSFNVLHYSLVPLSMTFSLETIKFIGSVNCIQTHKNYVA